MQRFVITEDGVMQKQDDGYVVNFEDVQALAAEALWALKHRDLPDGDIGQYVLRQRELMQQLRAIVGNAEGGKPTQEPYMPFDQRPADK